MSKQLIRLRCSTAGFEIANIRGLRSSKLRGIASRASTACPSGRNPGRGNVGQGRPRRQRVVEILFAHRPAPRCSGRIIDRDRRPRRASFGGRRRVRAGRRRLSRGLAASGRMTPPSDASLHAVDDRFGVMGITERANRERQLATDPAVQLAQTAIRIDLGTISPCWNSADRHGSQHRRLLAPAS